MPTIKPLDLSDCTRLIANHRQEIEQSLYDVEIEEDWIPSMSEADLVLLAKHSLRSKKTIALRSARSSVLHVLARDADKQIRRNVTWNGHASPELLHILAGDTDGDVRRGVAGNKNTAPDDLELLARDSNVDVRKWVAENERTPTTTLERLSQDSDSRVRWFVAGNPSTPLSNLKVLSKDPSADVRRKVAENQNTPPDSLSLLARDSSREAERRREWDKTTEGGEYEVRLAVAQNPHTPRASLELLARDSAVSEYYGESVVRKAVARNPSTPAHLLEALARDSDFKVREIVAENPNTPAAALDMLARLFEPPEGWKETVHASEIRKTVARNQNAPTGTLMRLAKDRDYGVRLAVASNRNTPRSALNFLARNFRADDFMYEKINKNKAARNIGGCFIASVCYGDGKCDEVLVLKRFRDRCLSRHLLGKCFIRAYYLLSPPMAKWLGRKHTLRLLIRSCFLDPIVSLVAAIAGGADIDS